MQNRSLRLLFVSFVLCFYSVTTTALAQEKCALRIRGYVVDETGSPLRDVLVQASDGMAVSTDHQGRFTVSSLCVGMHTVRCSFVGYQTNTSVVSLERDTILHIQLLNDAIHLQDVEIIGTQSETLSVGKQKLSLTELQERKGMTLAESLTALSGVTTIGMGNSIVKPVINGLHSNRILIMNNGIRQEGQQWGVEHAPEIDPFVADRLEVVKGAQGVRYGADALGGVVIATPNDIDLTVPWQGRFDLLGQSNGKGGMAHLRLEGNTSWLPNLGWRVQASGKKLGNYTSAGYYLGNTGVQELNYSAMLQYRDSLNSIEAFYSHFGTEIGIFLGAHIGTVEDIQARIAHGRPFETYDFSYTIAAPRQQVAHDLIKASWNHRYSPKSSLTMVYGFQRNHRKEYDVRRVESDDLPMADMVLTTQSLDAIFKQGNSSFGVQSLVQVNNNTPGTGTTPIIPNFDSYTLGAFAIHQFHVRRLHAELGARYDFKYLDVAGYRYKKGAANADGSIEQYLLTDTRKFHNASGTFGVLYHFSPRWSLKSNIGLAWRAPSANELYSDGVHHGSATYEVGDQSLRSEKGLKWINSLLWHTDRMQMSLDMHAQLVYDYIYAQPNPDSVRQTIRGTFPLFSYRQDDALFYGADLKWMYGIWPNIDYEGNVSILRAENRTRDRYLPYIPSDRLQHAVRWRYSRDQKEQDYIKFAHRFVAQQTRYDAGADYVAPPPAYHLFDVYISKQFAWRNDRQLVVLLSAENILNKEYKDYMDRFRYFTHQIGRNFHVKISYTF